MGSAMFAVATNMTFDKVVRNLEVVIREGVVLFGIEGTSREKRRRGIATEVVSDLVHLVHHENGVDHPTLLHPLNDLPGERADVGAPVATNGRFVVHAAEGDADKLPP